MLMFEAIKQHNSNPNRNPIISIAMHGKKHSRK